jgi:hypothetical protein
VTLTGRLTQHPIEFPGDIRVTARVDINRPLTATGHLRLDAEIQKWIVFDYFTLPCISNVGSWYVTGLTYLLISIIYFRIRTQFSQYHVFLLPFDTIFYKFVFHISKVIF